MSNATQSLEQKRAADALKKIKNLPKSEKSYYVSYVSALPATIVMNGLGQALAMLLAKDKGNRNSEHYSLFEHLATWLGGHIPELKADRPDGVLEKLMDSNQDVYVRAQSESMAYLHWLKQFARAYLKESEGQPDER